MEAAADTNGQVGPTEEPAALDATEETPQDPESVAAAAAADPSEAASKKRKLEDGAGVTDGAGELAFHSTDEATRQAMAQKWLAPLSEFDLRRLLVKIAVATPAAYAAIHQTAAEDPVHRKLFIRGLSWTTTSEMLKEAFVCHGEISEAVAVQDKVTGKNKGFGFVTYETMEAAYAALENPSKELDGRTVECNLAALKSSQSRSGFHGAPVTGGAGGGGGGGAGGIHGGSVSASGEPEAVRKLFIKGLNYDTTTETVKSYFGQYGEIEFCQVITHKDTGKSKGYGFCTFTTAAGAQAALAQPEKHIDGRNTQCNLAEAGKAAQTSMGGGGYGQQMGMAMGYNRMGGGGYGQQQGMYGGQQQGYGQQQQQWSGQQQQWGAQQQRMAGGQQYSHHAQLGQPIQPGMDATQQGQQWG